MGTFRMRVDCDNAAFEGDPGQELSRILRALADAMRLDDTTCGKLRDINGNTTGSWTFTADDP